jgi:hypothetical protein
MKLKNIIKEHSLGELPSSKLIKMKWNPLTEKGPVREQESPGENDIMGELVNLLQTWEDNQHPYYKDVANLVGRYTGK